MSFSVPHLSLMMCLALLLMPVRAVAQQIGTFVGESPIYLLPDASRAPLLVASTGSTADIVATEGAWLRVSFEDPQGRTRVGYVDARLVRVSERQVPAAAPSIGRETSPNPSRPAVASLARKRVLNVTIVDRKNSDTLYTYVSPALATPAPAPDPNCAGPATRATPPSTSVNVHCGATSSTKTAFRPSLERGYAVRGTTFTLKLPDGRHLVVNCQNTDVLGLDGTRRRSCRTPLVDQITAEFDGENAKLIWPASDDGKKTESETYRILAILGDPS